MSWLCCDTGMRSGGYDHDHHCRYFDARVDRAHFEERQAAGWRAQEEARRKAAADNRCEKCGKPLTPGAWPWCDHQPVQPTRFLWNKVK
jgi:hypothetical protein